ARITCMKSCLSRTPSHVGLVAEKSQPALVLVDGRHLSGFGATRGFGRYLRALLAEFARNPTLTVHVLATTDGAAAVPEGISAVVVGRRLPGRFADRDHRARRPLQLAIHPPGRFHRP